MTGALGPLQLFTLAFGTIVGIAWVFLTGSWLAAAGSLGTVLALCAGAAAMLPIVAAYSNLARLIPAEGGEILYARRAAGARAGFLAGWTLAAAYISLVSFICVTVAWLVDVSLVQIGKQLNLGVGDPQWIGVGVSAACFVMVIAANLRGIAKAAHLQDVIVYLMLAAVVGMAATALFAGRVANLDPYFVAAPAFADRKLAGVLAGISSVLVTAPFLYAGFNTAVQAMSAADPTRLHRVKRAFVAAVIAAAGFYSIVVLSTALTMPREQLLAEELPAITGLSTALNSPLAAAFVCIVGLLALASSWNGVFLAACRILAVLSEQRFLPYILRASRTAAAATVVIVSLALTASGREAVTVTVSTVSFFMAIAFAAASYAAWRLSSASAPGQRGIAVLALALCAGLIVLSLREMLAGERGILQLTFIGAWLALGAVLAFRRPVDAEALE